MRVAFLLILLCDFAPAQRAGMEGVVIDAITRQPLAGVHITMRPMSSQDQPYGAISRGNGHFSIASMPPDVYSLTAQRNGYVHLQETVNVVLQPGEERTGFTV